MDYQATTPLDARVLEAMLPYLRERFGNPSSRSHLYGIEAAAATKRARGQVARILGADPVEIVFTSGSTEALNLAIRGAAEAYAAKGRHFVSAATEHPAVLDALRAEEARGATVTWLPLDPAGRIDLGDLERAIGPETVLVALMAANNEIGTRHPVAAIGRICRARGALYLCDATQAIGKFPLDVRAEHVDLLALSAHKLYGPKGAGALFVRGSDPHVRIAAQVHGGGHERGLRSGTLNVPGIVGLGAACALAEAELPAEQPRIEALRRRLFQHIAAGVDHVLLNGPAEERIPGNLNLAFEHVDGEALLMELKDVALSSGSACNSASLEPSHVLKAIGLSDALAFASLRFGLGRMTTAAEVDAVGSMVVAAVRKLREESPWYGGRG